VAERAPRAHAYVRNEGEHNSFAPRARAPMGFALRNSWLI